MTILHTEKSVSYQQNFCLKYKPCYSIEKGVYMKHNTERKEPLNNLWVKADEYEDVVSELLATKQAYNLLFEQLSKEVVSNIKTIKQQRLDSLKTGD